LSRVDNAVTKHTHTNTVIDNIKSAP